MGKTHQVSLFYIKLKDPQLRERLAQRVSRTWKDLELSGTSDFANKEQMGEMMKSFVWAIVALAIIIGGVGMMNAQLTSVMERTREIGVLRSIGWSSFRILTMILGESIGVCLIGGILGTGLAWLTLITFSDAFISFGSGRITLDILAQAFCTVLILGIFGGLYPAWRAARLTPVEALRYEGSAGGSKVRRLPFGGLAIQNLWQRTTRTLLTLFVIGLTIGGIMLMEAVVRGLIASMSQMGSDAEVFVRQANIADTSLSAVDARDGEKIAAMPEVQNVSGVIITAISLPEQGGFFIIQGYAPNEYAIRRFKILSGERITNNRQIMIGRTIADSLHKKVGDTITLSNIRYRIVGIFETGIGWEELGGVMTLRDAQTFLGRPRKVSVYAVKLRESSQAEKVVLKINEQLKDVHAALAGDFANELPDIKNTNAMMAGISLLAIIVGGVGVLNTMLMSVLERTREIGVLRALGWRRRAILGLISNEAILIGIFGGILGVGIAFGLAYIFQLIPEVSSYITPIWGIDIFIRALVIALLLGILGGIYPALRATNLKPVEALRYE
jgi:ABC-type antimicrobial peptide transport system permease subunit